MRAYGASVLCRVSGMPKAYVALVLSSIHVVFWFVIWTNEIYSVGTRISL